MEKNNAFLASRKHYSPLDVHEGETTPPPKTALVTATHRPPKRLLVPRKRKLL